MKTIIRLFISICILFTLYSTNPTKEDFKEYFIDYEVDSGLIAEKITGLVIDSECVRKDYYLFSVFKLDDRSYLGAMKMFVKISRSSDDSR